jgi:uncharacterized protein YjbJ (UPF0337 family)
MEEIHVPTTLQLPSELIERPSDGRRPRGRSQEVEMNKDTLQGQWMQLKGKVREQWGKLTDDDIDQIEGQAEQLVGRVQQRYGIARDEAQRQVDAWIDAETARYTALP